MESKLMPNHNRNGLQDRKPLKERLKVLYNKKRENQHFNTNENETAFKSIEHADITNNFQKEIEKNLV